jgi:transporter family protein
MLEEWFFGVGIIMFGHTKYMGYVFFALISAVSAALVAIFGKIGVRDVNSNLAVAIRTTVILVFAWGLVFWTGVASEITKISKYSWTFLVLSALATGVSWFAYYRALQIGEASRVAPIDKLSIALTLILAFVFLGEKPTLGNVVGGLLVTLGVLATVFIK